MSCARPPVDREMRERRARQLHCQVAATRGGEYARLPRGLELRLVQAAKDGDAEQLIEAFEPSIRAMARLYRGASPVTRAELLQEGVVGLLRAVERYDPDIGTPFWAYASWWVRQAMQQLVSELALPVVLSDRALRQLARVKAAHSAYVQKHGGEPARKDLARMAGLTTRQVEKLIVADRHPRGMEEPIRGGEGAGGTLGELLADPHAEDAFDRVSMIEREDLMRLLATLTERERCILTARFGLDGGEEATLRELGVALGVSAERVRQIEERALEKLRAGARLLGGAPVARRRARQATLVTGPARGRSRRGAAR